MASTLGWVKRGTASLLVASFKAAVAASTVSAFLVTSKLVSMRTTFGAQPNTPAVDYDGDKLRVAAATKNRTYPTGRLHIVCASCASACGPPAR